MFEAMDYFNYRHKEEAEDKSYYYGFDGGFVGNGLNGRRRSCGGGFFGGGLGCGLGGGVGLEGGVVLVGYSLAVGNGGESGGVANIICLDGDCGGFADGVVDGEGY